MKMGNLCFWKMMAKKEAKLDVKCNSHQETYPQNLFHSFSNQITQNLTKAAPLYKPFAFFLPLKLRKQKK